MSRPRQRYHWTHELDSVLESGYREGRSGLVRAINSITTSTGWPRQACHDRGRKLGLPIRYGSRHRRWTTTDEDLLKYTIEAKTLRTAAHELGRTPKAIRHRLTKMGYRHQPDDLSKQRLADTLHASAATVERWIDHGWIATGRNGRRHTVSIHSLGRFVEHHLSEINLTLLTKDSCELLLYALNEYRTSGEEQ